mmetsp:Transcript_7072/g.17533  ORF Transcript_7072/g.17533 Transcript_7072/m.17533 type:complete len:219 (-) Transcript_7072:103-759(-)
MALLMCGRCFAARWLMLLLGRHRIQRHPGGCRDAHQDLRRSTAVRSHALRGWRVPLAARRVRMKSVLTISVDLIRMSAEDQINEGAKIRTTVNTTRLAVDDLVSILTQSILIINPAASIFPIGPHGVVEQARWHRLRSDTEAGRFTYHVNAMPPFIATVVSVPCQLMVVAIIPEARRPRQVGCCSTGGGSAGVAAIPDKAVDIGGRSRWLVRCRTLRC